MTAPRTMGDAAWWLGSRGYGVLALLLVSVVGLLVLALIS
jgi:hypothetical protein